MVIKQRRGERRGVIIQFNADFVWGAATSGPQAEGTFHYGFLFSGQD